MERSCPHHSRFLFPLIALVVFILFYVYGFFAHMYVCVPRACLMPIKYQKARVLGLLNLKIQMVVSHVVLGIERESSGRATVF